MAVPNRHFRASLAKRRWNPGVALAETLDRLSVIAIFAIIVMSALALASADYLFPGVGMGPLYIPIIALATWRVGLRAGSVTMVGAVALNAVSMVQDGDGGPHGLMLARGLVRLSSYAFIILIMSGARRAYVRERDVGRIDPLTGLCHRGAFEDMLDQVLSGVSDRPAFLIAMIDLDDFKAINDTYGHAAGDTALRDFAKGAMIRLSASDHLARVGGDEFLLLALLNPAADPEEIAQKLHSRLVDAIEALPFETSISMGVLVVPPTARLNREDILRGADQLLYAVKRSGKRAMMIGVASAQGHSPVDERYASLEQADLARR